MSITPDFWQVLPGLYQGSVDCLKHVLSNQPVQFQLIICCALELDLIAAKRREMELLVKMNKLEEYVPWPPNLRLLKMEWVDEDDQHFNFHDMYRKFQAVEQHLKKQNNVLVMCQLGMSRSSAFILYVLSTYCQPNISIRTALTFLKRSNPTVVPRASFVTQLERNWTWMKILNVNIAKYPTEEEQSKLKQKCWWVPEIHGELQKQIQQKFPGTHLLAYPTAHATNQILELLKETRLESKNSGGKTETWVDRCLLEPWPGQILQKQEKPGIMPATYVALDGLLLTRDDGLWRHHQWWKCSDTDRIWESDNNELGLLYLVFPSPIKSSSSSSSSTLLSV
jgi:protein-tyrosine phosphatase